MASINKIPGNFPTIQEAINATNPGGEVHIQLVNPLHVENRVQVDNGKKVVIESGIDGQVTWTGTDKGVWGLLEVRSKSSVSLKNINLTSKGHTRGIWAKDSTLTLNSCLLNENERASYAGVGGFGGAMECRGCNVTVEQCEIKNNKIFDGGALVGCYGGGLYFSQNCNVKISHSTIHGNIIFNGDLPTMQGWGGGLFVEDSELTLEDSRIFDNQSYAGQASGGGIYLKNVSRARFIRSVIEANSVSSKVAKGKVGKIEVGGGIYFDNCEYKCSFEDTIIKDNSNDVAHDVFTIVFSK